MALKSRIPRLRAALLAGIDPAVREAVDAGKALRDRLVPVDTGALKASGLVEKVADAHYRLSEGRGLPDARAAYTEFGTSRQAAQPHMTPAAEAMRRSAPAQIADVLRARLRRV